MRTGLIGKKIAYSLSPVIHRFLFDALNIDASYEILDREAKEMGEAFSGTYRGLNVTIPYKVEVLKYMTRLDGSAEKIGAVNTVLFQGKEVIGYNTDVYGAMVMMEGLRVSEGRVTVIGSGGAARAVIAAAQSMGAREITVAGRNAKALQRLKQDFSSVSVQGNKSLPGGDVLVNATPCGTCNAKMDWAFPENELKKYKGAADVVYSPLKTPMRLKAESLGMTTRGGLEMLCAQAVQAEEIWLGEKIPETVSKDLVAYMKQYTEK